MMKIGFFDYYIRGLRMAFVPNSEPERKACERMEDLGLAVYTTEVHRNDNKSGAYMLTKKGMKMVKSTEGETWPKKYQIG